MASGGGNGTAVLFGSYSDAQTMRWSVPCGPGSAMRQTDSARELLQLC